MGPWSKAVVAFPVAPVRSSEGAGGLQNLTARRSRMQYRADDPRGCGFPGTPHGGGRARRVRRLLRRRAFWLSPSVPAHDALGHVAAQRDPDDRTVARAATALVDLSVRSLAGASGRGAGGRMADVAGADPFRHHCSEALFAAGGVRWLSDAPTRFDTLRRVVVFIIAAVIVAPFLSSFPDAAAVAGPGPCRSPARSKRRVSARCS